MKCENCGRELEPGELECECGVKTDPTNEDKKDKKSSKVLTPDGRDLSELEKPAVKKKDVSPLFVVVAGLIICLAAVIVYIVIVGNDLRDKDNWEEVTGDGYSITIPKMMKKSNDKVADDQDYKALGLYKSKKACVYISKAELNDEEKEVVKSRGIDEIKKTMIENSDGKTIKGYTLSPVEEGDFIILEYPVTDSSFIDGENDLWAVSATLVTSDGLYQIDAYCTNDNKTKYAESMTEWVTSFEVK